MKLGDALPSFHGATAWIRGEPAPAPGAIVLVHFWSSRCPLCHEGAHEIAGWRSRFAARDLEAVAVFQPRAGEAVDISMVESEARDKMSIDYSCAIDGEGLLARRFANSYPPGYYLFDRDFRLRHRQMGNAELRRVGTILSGLAVKASADDPAY